MPPKQAKKSKAEIEAEEEAARLEEEERQRKEEEEKSPVEAPIPDHIQSLAWRVLGPKAFRDIFAAKTSTEIIDIIAGRLGLEEYEENHMHTLLLETHVDVINFGKKEAMSQEQISTLVTIMHRTREFACSQRSGQDIGLDEVFAYFKDMILKHSADDLPVYTFVFTPEQVRSIVTWATTGFFTHLRLYQVAFSEERPCDKSSLTLFMHTAAPWPPFESGTDPNAKEGVQSGDDAQAEQIGSPLGDGEQPFAPEDMAGSQENEESNADEAKLGLGANEDEVKKTMDVVISRAVGPMKRELEAKFEQRMKMLESKLERLEAGT